MKKHVAVVSGLLALAVAVGLLWNNLAPAQLGERPGNSQDNPIDTPRDLSGLSIKIPRVRVIHTTDPHKPGGSMYLQQVDPFLGYTDEVTLTVP